MQGGHQAFSQAHQIVLASLFDSHGIGRRMFSCKMRDTTKTGRQVSSQGRTRSSSSARSAATKLRGKPIFQEMRCEPGSQSLCIRPLQVVLVSPHGGLEGGG